MRTETKNETTLQNIHTYVDYTRGIVGVFATRGDGRELFRVEKPKDDRIELTDAEILQMVDEGLENPFV